MSSLAQAGALLYDLLLLTYSDRVEATLARLADAKQFCAAGVGLHELGTAWMPSNAAPHYSAGATATPGPPLRPTPRTEMTADPVHPRGRAVVLDFGAYSPVSAQAVRHLRANGLTTNDRCINTHQLPNACGYLAAGWCILLRHMGAAFDQVTTANANVLNSQAFIAQCNYELGLDGANGRLDSGVFLTGDQILGLIDRRVDPDERGNLRWVSGPMPLNLFYQYFDRTVAGSDKSERGTIHVAVVNTECADPSLSDQIVGVHWFVVAWQVDEDAEPAMQVD